MAQAKHYCSSSWVDPRIDVRKSGIEGQGGFARGFIPKGQILAVIGG